VSGKARVVSVNISDRVGEKKNNVHDCPVVVGHGLEGDAHAGGWHRQVSLLAVESIDRMRSEGADVWPGDFAENITVQGMDLVSLPLGAKLRVGEDVVLEITQHGKECHRGCAIRELAGDCVMPREGVFATVLEGGRAAVGDEVRLLEEGGGEDV